MVVCICVRLREKLCFPYAVPVMCDVSRVGWKSGKCHLFIHLLLLLFPASTQTPDWQQSQSASKHRKSIFPTIEIIANLQVNICKVYSTSAFRCFGWEFNFVHCNYKAHKKSVWESERAKKILQCRIIAIQLANQSNCEFNRYSGEFVNTDWHIWLDGRCFIDSFGIFSSVL